MGCSANEDELDELFIQLGESDEGSLMFVKKGNSSSRCQTRRVESWIRTSKRKGLDELTAQLGESGQLEVDFDLDLVGGKIVILP